MKNIIRYLITCMIILPSCSKAPTDYKEENLYRIVPDETPFISGLLEATNDTVHHYPEVVVGYVSDGNFDSNYQEVQDIEGLYNPTLWTQVVRTLQRFKLTFREETKAKVTVTGPLGDPSEKTVVYTHEGNGVYGDIHSKLELVSSKKYVLEVLFPDYRIYRKEIKILDSLEIEVPTKADLNVEFRPYEDGTPYESSNPHLKIPFGYPKDTFIVEIQSNSNNDRDILLLEPWENFLFEDRSEYLRLGLVYTIAVNPENKTDTLERGWWKDINEKLPTSQLTWIRLSYFDNGMWENFQNLNDWFSTNGQEWETMYSRFEEALSTRDSTYLFEVSTIEKLGENGEILPKSENDAIGFFAGYFSVYKKTVLIPVRNFDLDSVLTAHGY